ncbi:hypothetical protein SORBI_3010G225226 [Sorghum bicolor]|uniref:Uncharacterized protein n=1 Tax=Sorghum bicolor TaxID=4558 RepID=A0A1W0VU98_SORBI|nr:hypothetical protein SORBI_3010G225226 [Sorghum bicolor]
MQVSDTTSSTPILPPHCVFSLVDLHLPLPSTELGRYAGSSAARTDLHAGRRGQDDGARARPGPCRWPHCGCHPAAALPHSSVQLDFGLLHQGENSKDLSEDGRIGDAQALVPVYVRE